MVAAAVAAARHSGAHPSSYTGDRGTLSLSSRPASSTYQIPVQSELHSVTLSLTGVGGD